MKQIKSLKGFISAALSKIDTKHIKVEFTAFERNNWDGCIEQRFTVTDFETTGFDIFDIDTTRERVDTDEVSLLLDIGGIDSIEISSDTHVKSTLDALVQNNDAEFQDFVDILQKAFDKWFNETDFKALED